MFVISVLAAVCSTTASIPQLMGNVEELSNVTMILRGIGALLWCIYGILKQEYALVVSSAAAGIIEGSLFVKTNYHTPKRWNSSLSDTVPSPTDAESNSSVIIDRVNLT